MPPNFVTVQSRSRPGTTVYEDITTRRRYGSLAQSWRAYRQRQAPHSGTTTSTSTTPNLNNNNNIISESVNNNTVDSKKPDSSSLEDLVAPSTTPVPVEFPFMAEENRVKYYNNCLYKFAAADLSHPCDLLHLMSNNNFNRPCASTRLKFDNLSSRLVTTKPRRTRLNQVFESIEETTPRLLEESNRSETPKSDITSLNNINLHFNNSTDQLVQDTTVWIVGDSAVIECPTFATTTTPKFF